MWNDDDGAFGLDMTPAADHDAPVPAEGVADTKESGYVSPRQGAGGANLPPRGDALFDT